MVAIAIGLDRILIGIIGLIVIGSDRISIGINSGSDLGFDGGFNGGLFNWFHLAMLGCQPQQSIQQLRWEDIVAISQEGLTGSFYGLVILRAIIIVF